jgi:hypothetical protein
MEKCRFEGCTATTERPGIDKWAWLSGYPVGVPDGFYCPRHAAAIEELLVEGGLDDPESDLR